jgi:hypothetical protein
MIILANERTLLTVAIPVWEADRLLELFYIPAEVARELLYNYSTN